MKRYRYSGPVSSITFPDGQCLTLVPGHVELPDHPRVRQLLALGYLQPSCSRCKTGRPLDKLADTQELANETTTKTPAVTRHKQKRGKQ